jgi:hypothetical protein
MINCIKSTKTSVSLPFCFILLLSISGLSIAANTTLISPGASWTYLDDGSNQQTAWNTPGFNDSQWSSGNAELGYGDEKEVTTISYGSNSDDKYITTYFRHDFTVTGATSYQSLILRILRDDGAVIYLNGNEIHRTNMPTDTIGYDTTASSQVYGSSETTFFETQHSTEYLLEGTNVLAVEIHQAKPTSSDVSFNLELLGSTDPVTTQMVKGPYLIYPNDITSMKILWQTSVTDTCQLEWGRDLSYSDGSLISSEVNSYYHQHIQTLNTLTADSLYYYRVTAGGNIYTGSFRSAPNTNQTSVSFLAYGDTRSNPSVHNSVCEKIVQAYTNDPKCQTFLLHVGDWVDNGNDEAQWNSEYFPRNQPSIIQMQANLPILGCIGGHEQNGVLFQKYWPYPFEQDRYWSFDYGPVHVAIVDQYVDYGAGSDQLSWLDQDLSNSDKQWKFVVLHEPGWSAGTHGNNTTVQNYIQPLCEKYNVSIVFCGHNHNYARARVNNTHHVTTGGGGAPLYTPNPGSPNLVTCSKSYQYSKISVNEKQLDFESVDINGTVIDEFTILYADLPPEDGIVDLYDFIKISNNWLESDCGHCNGADISGDGHVNIADVFEFAYSWLNQTQ